MAVQYTPYALLSLISAAALAALASLAWSRRGAPGARPFAALMLAGCWWKLAYALGLASAGLDAKLFWAKAEYLGVAIVPLAWLALALGYAAVWDRRTRRRLLALLAVVPLITVALAWTNGASGEPHGLLWASAVLDRSGPFAALEVSAGPWYPVHVVYSYALVLAGTVVLVAAVARSSRAYLVQGLALLAGALVSWAANALYLLGIEPVTNLNPSVLVFPVTGALFALGLFRFGLLDLSPVARDAAFGAAGDGLVVVDPRGRVVDVNPAAERILGRRTPRLLGRSVSELIPARLPPLDATYTSAEARHQEVTLGEAVPRRYDLAQAPLEDRGGRVVGRLLSLRDVTEQRRTEEALAESEERFKALVQNTSDMISILDPDGTIRYISPSVERVLGYSPEERTGEDAFGDVTHPEDAATTRRLFAEGLGRPGGVSGPLAFRVRHKDGSWRNVEAVAANALDHPAVGGVVVNARDVTERERAGEALREANRRLEELASLRADFAAMVAHEIGTPLAAIRAYADVLRIADVSPGVRADAIDKIREEAEGISTLVADVRSAAAVERGDFDLSVRPVPAGELLEDAIGFARTLAGNHPIVVEPDAAGEPVRADPYRAGQVLRNLLTNAAKYSPEGAPITLRAVRGAAPGRVRMEVADRGPGVGPEDAERIFEKFGRARDSGPRAYGVGLGLYLSRRIAQAHGGELAHRPNPGGGSVFWLELAAVGTPDP